MARKLSAGLLMLSLAAAWLVATAMSLVCCSAGMHGYGAVVGYFLPILILGGCAALTILLVRWHAK